MFKKKYLLLTLFLIIIFQILLYTNNNQKTSFRYFKWTFQEVSIGKLISISFFSGLFVSTLLNTTINGNSFRKKTFENVEGLVHVSSLNNDWYEYRSRQNLLIGRKSKKSYKVGDPIEVKIIKVDILKYQIDLELT